MSALVQPLDYSRDLQPRRAGDDNLTTRLIVRLRPLYFACILVMYLSAYNGQWRVSRDSDLYRGIAESDIRRALIEADHLLLVRERTDGRWTLPGGFADLGRSAAENVEKEIHEEAEAVSNYRTGETSSGTSLGDLLKEHIGSQDN